MSYPFTGWSEQYERDVAWMLTDGTYYGPLPTMGCAWRGFESLYDQRIGWKSRVGRFLRKRHGSYHYFSLGRKERDWQSILPDRDPIFAELDKRIPIEDPEPRLSERMNARLERHTFAAEMNGVFKPDVSFDGTLAWGHFPNGKKRSLGFPSLHATPEGLIASYRQSLAYVGFVLPITFRLNFTIDQWETAGGYWMYTLERALNAAPEAQEDR